MDGGVTSSYFLVSLLRDIMYFYAMNYGPGAWTKGDIKGGKAMNEAYERGRNI